MQTPFYGADPRCQPDDLHGSSHRDSFNSHTTREYQGKPSAFVPPQAAPAPQVPTTREVLNSFRSGLDDGDGNIEATLDTAAHEKLINGPCQGLESGREGLHTAPRSGVRNGPTDPYTTRCALSDARLLSTLVRARDALPLGASGREQLEAQIAHLEGELAAMGVTP